MNRDLILRLYDDELRRNVPYFDDQLRFERTDTLVRLVGATADPGNNCVLYSALDKATAGAAIDREIAYFSALGHSFEWKHHDHDQPSDLPQLLLDRGFSKSEPEQIVAIDLAQWADTSQLPAGYTISRLNPGDSLAAVKQVQEAVWPDISHDWLLDSLQRERVGQPDSIDFYVVWSGTLPVCSGWTRYHGRFASLFGGSTRSEHRGRGLYRALLSTRLRDAISKGAAYGLVDAGPMSYPILLRLGFVDLTGTTPYLYNLPAV